MRKLAKRKPSHTLIHWWIERFTAVLLIPLCLWFFYSLITVLLSPDPAQLQFFLAVPFNAIMTVLLLVLLFVHAKMGNEVIIEDYVRGKPKCVLSALNLVLSYGAMAVSVAAVIKMYLQVGT